MVVRLSHRNGVHEGFNLGVFRIYFWKSFRTNSQDFNLWLDQRGTMSFSIVTLSIMSFSIVGSEYVIFHSIIMHIQARISSQQIVKRATYSKVPYSNYTHINRPEERFKPGSTAKKNGRGGIRIRDLSILRRPLYHSATAPSD